MPPHYSLVRNEDQTESPRAATLISTDVGAVRMLRRIRAPPHPCTQVGNRGIQIITLGRRAVICFRDHRGRTCFQNCFRILPARHSPLAPSAHLIGRKMTILPLIHGRELRRSAAPKKRWNRWWGLNRKKGRGWEPNRGRRSIRRGHQSRGVTR